MIIMAGTGFWNRKIRQENWTAMALLPALIMSSPGGNAHQLFKEGDVQAADLICTASCIAGPAAVAATKDGCRM